jgi:3-hydroxyisobutyrate dehydrogenase-like beta-hydroxyacid dehydrogenase
MTRVAFLGLGAMGRRMVRRLAATRFDVTVWSRSGVPRDIHDLGLRWAPSPRDASRGADIILSMVTDDEASRAVWAAPGSGALEAVREGTLAIECSTLEPQWVSSLGLLVEERRGRFLDAPVVGSRPQAEAGRLVHLVGGSADDMERARPVLAAMSSAIHHVGGIAAGAVAKLAANTLFGVQVALLGELLGFGRLGGLDEKRLVDVLGALPIMSPAAKVAADAMLAGAFAPMFPIDLVAKDFRYVAAAAELARARVPIAGAARAVFDDAVVRGLGAENITAVVKRYGS